MSSNAPDPNAAPPMPTQDDARAIFDRATEAAQRAESAAERLEAAQRAAGSETRDRFPGMPEELVKQISEQTARATVDAISAQYELAQNPPPGDQPPADQPPADQAPAGQPPPVEAPPSLARRILGY